MIRRSFWLPQADRIVRPMLLTATVLIASCSQAPDGRPSVYPVDGKVLYKGQPVPGGVVLFEWEEVDQKASGSAPGSGPLRATGRIGVDGRFRLMAFPGTEGVPAGDYKVGISSLPPRNEGNLLEAAGSAKKGNPDVLRGKYSDPKSSGLRAKVLKDQPNEPTFDLN